MELGGVEVFAPGGGAELNTMVGHGHDVSTDRQRIAVDKIHVAAGRHAVERQLADGYDVLLDIDWQGARQVRRSFPASRGVFILPPSMHILRERLTDRGQDDPAVIERRMRDARAEISHWAEFDFVVVNDDFEAALDDLQAIVRTGRPVRRDQENRVREILADFLETG